MPKATIILTGANSEMQEALRRFLKDREKVAISTINNNFDELNGIHKEYGASKHYFICGPYASFSERFCSLNKIRTENADDNNGFRNLIIFIIEILFKSESSIQLYFAT